MRIHDISLLWAAAMDVKFNAKKSAVFGPAERQEELQLNVARDRIPFYQKAELLCESVAARAIALGGPSDRRV